MIVRFATVCDTPGCGKRSLEYTAYPSCRICYQECCPEHQRPGTLRQDEGVNDCLCLTCDPEDE